MKTGKSPAKQGFFKMLLVLAAWCALIFPTLQARAFALLGPYEAWMQYTNGLRQVGDIGGPMDIGNGYRWNVPVITYGFDQSFISYFGSNGVAAVTGAIQILNALPPASQLAFTNYPLLSRRINYNAAAQNLLDLKSASLSLLLEHMGLTQPARYIIVIKQWSAALGVPVYELNWQDFIPDYIVQRNFDPQALSPSFYVNGTLYDFYFGELGYEQFTGTFAVDPSAPAPNAVADYETADSGLPYGGYFIGLTEDDVGGLSYLLSTNLINFENLLPGVVAAGTNANSLVNGAWRPGIDKITFVSQPVDPVSGAFLTTTNPYDDIYITNGVMMQQQVERVIAQPDVLFCFGASGLYPLVDRTGTTNWINNAVLNGNATNGGPGVIQPQVRITFNRIGHQLELAYNGSVTDRPFIWGSFDGSPNPPIAYPVSQTVTNPFLIRLTLDIVNGPNLIQNDFAWTLTNAIGSVALFQTSTNLVDWVTMFSATNDGTIWDLFIAFPTEPCRFYRVAPIGQ